MLNYIFHLSDLHIRNGDKTYCRYDEYKLVFNNTINSIKNQVDKLSLTDFIIIITGDIFHNKNNIGNHGLLLYKDFIHDLTKIGKVIILHGNHDKNQSEANQPSLVFSSTFNINNLMILNETKSFVIDDIGFSYVSIDDTLDVYRNSGRIQDLPKFPDINAKVKYKIALFHGSFASAKLFNGEIIRDENNPYPLEWVQDFDYVLLGDIHKRQMFSYKKKTICGYSGSLIQQNFGEDIIDHGYLIWNLETKKIKEINVYNQIGYINIKQNDNDDILIRINGNYEDLLEEVIKNNLEYFPKKLEIKSYSKINFEKLNILLKSYDIYFTIVSRINNDKLLSLTLDDENSNINDFNVIDNNYILSYFNNLLSPINYNKLVEIINNKELLLFYIDKYPDDLHSECLKRNKELSAAINNCIKNDDIKKTKHPFLIRYLEWEGLLCYENKNWLNMHELDAKTFMIKGKNGTGKSAIYDILLLAIWGENTKGCNFSSGKINFNKTNAYTIVDIELNGILYRIQRDYAKIPNNTKINFKHCHLYKFTNETDLELLKKESAANADIKLLFGDIDNFLSSSMITQNVDNDILKLDPKQTLEIIDKSSNVQYIYHLYNLFKTAINKYKDFRRIVETKRDVYEKLVSNCIIDDHEDVNEEELLLKINEKEDLIKELKIDNECKEKYNQLKYSLKDESDLSIYVDLYNSNVVPMNKINKPCELYLLKQEEEFLKPHFNRKFADDIEIRLKLLQDEERLMILNKPANVNKPSSSEKQKIINDINAIYNSIDELKEFVESLNTTNKNPKITNNSLTYNEYKKNLVKEVFIDHNKPLEEIKFKNITSINKELKTINIKIVLKQIEEDEKILPIIIELDNYKNELLLLTSSEEYEYDPNCKFCCKRPWVSRIKELNIIINKLENDINHKHKDYHERAEKNKNIKNYYDLLNDWLLYYKSNNLKKRIEDNNNFINYSVFLYEQLINKIWNDNYNELRSKIIDLENDKNIKPRIDKYLELKELYDKWYEYDLNTKIINTNELFKLQELLDSYEYDNLRVSELIREKEKEIKILNDKLIKFSTINSYNKQNKENYNKLLAITSDLDSILEILETIIVNFQSFRIEMYDKFILNKLTDRTNCIIKSLCHCDTKPFRLDYIITIVKDIIHINWLINNDNTKQIISINQASGFQHFAISLALRMSLFINNYDVQCNQLFIDEGFINFDKFNLSIVPTFLKSLLSFFNNIIIVSHIDLIQDNVDEIVEINYNKSTLVSSMQYNCFKKTIVKRSHK